MSKGYTKQMMACLNNLTLGLMLSKNKYHYLPTARRYFDARPNETFALITQLKESPLVAEIRIEAKGEFHLLLKFAGNNDLFSH